MIQLKLNSYLVIIGLYFLSMINMIHRLGTYSSTNFQSVATADNYMYGWIPETVDVNAWLSFINPALMVFLILLFPLLRFPAARILWFFASYIVEGFQFAYILGHSSHALVWFTLFLALIPGDLNDRADKESSDLDGFVRVCQLQIFLIYGTAGIWKVFGFVESLSNPNVASGLDYVQYAMASEFMYSNRLFASAEWVSNQPWLCMIFSGLVVVAQAGSLVMAFFPRFYQYWGLILAIFHVGTLFTVNVFFYWSIPPILWLLAFYPMSEKSFKDTLGKITGPSFRWRARVG